MPTVLRADGFQVMIFKSAREHPPPHVHVFRGRRAEVVILLGNGERLPYVREVRCIGPREVARALRLVRQHAEFLRQRWRDFHGED